MISNSGSDERGKYSGGSAGDQTGNEWTIRTWYNRPWDGVLRYNGANADEVRRYIRNWAIKAANNNHIGYDQGQRYTFWNNLAINGYDPSNITSDCESDCSAGVLAICKAVGYTLGIQSLKNIDHTGYTGNMKTILGNAGFVWLSDSKYRNGEGSLIEGDILLNIKSHTATYVGDGSISGGSTPTEFYYGRTTIEPFESSKSVKEMKAALTVLGWFSEAINETYTDYFYQQLKKFQDYHLGSAQADGIASKGGWTWRKIDYLIDAEDKDPFIEYGMTGKGVYQVQWKLNKLGYNCGTADGIYGDNTYKAICQFQDHYGFGADGKCYPNGYTYNKINSLIG